MKKYLPNIVTIMQVRRGSSRLPDKVLLPILNDYLFIRQYERMRASKFGGTIVVATTTDDADDTIEEICVKRKIDFFRGHPTDLLDRHYQTALAYNADIVLKIPSDCPLIDPAIIDQVVSYFLENEQHLDFASNLHPASFPDGYDVEVMPMHILEKVWQEAAKDFEREHTTPFIWERPDRFRIGNVSMPDKTDLSLIHRWTIDYPEDYTFIQKVYEALYHQNKYFGMNDILNLLQQQPAIFNINHHLAGVNWYRHHLDQLTTVGASQTKEIIVNKQTK